MKKITLTFLMSCLAILGFAQQKADKSASVHPALTPVQRDVIELSKLYALSALQVQDIAVIQQHKHQNLALIEPLKNTHFEAYFEQYQALRENVEQGIFAVLEENQRVIFRREVERSLAVRMFTEAVMTKEGKSSLDIKKALVEVRF